MTDPRRRALEARREQALADIDDVGRQVAEDELDEATAEMLRERYRGDAAAVEAALGEIDDAPSGRSGRRILVGVGFAAVVAAIAVIAVVQAIEPRPPGGFATGGVVTDNPPPVDLSQVTNEELEAVVASNPDVVDMRLALARRYVEAGEFPAALPHYLYVLEREQNPEALAYVGWMTYLSGDTPTGAAYLERSLDADPDFVVASWFLANVRFYGQDDPEGAIPLLEAVLASEVTPDDVVAEAESMLEAASP